MSFLPCRWLQLLHTDFLAPLCLSGTSCTCCLIDLPKISLLSSVLFKNSWGQWLMPNEHLGNAWPCAQHFPGSFKSSPTAHLGDQYHFIPFYEIENWGLVKINRCAFESMAKPWFKCSLGGPKPTCPTTAPFCLADHKLGFTVIAQSSKALSVQFCFLMLQDSLQRILLVLQNLLPVSNFDHLSIILWTIYLVFISVSWLMTPSQHRPWRLEFVFSKAGP